MSSQYRPGRIGLTAVFAAGVLAAFPLIVLAQGSGSSRATPSRPRQPTTEEFAASMWRFINRDSASYRAWASAAPAAPETVDDPHGTGGKAYWNDVAAKDARQIPFGSILVRDEYDDAGRKLRSVSVMYRVTGADPKNGDWYWMQFDPAGSLMKSPEAGNRPIVGRVASCIACHQKADGGDYVFSTGPATVPSDE